MADRYPLSWPADPVRWLSPAGCLTAWVAESGGAVAGHVCVVGGVSDPAVAGARDLATVSRLFVAPTARGRNLGESLLATATAYAADQSLQLMLDVVDYGGPAVALYERLGWRLIDRRPANWTAPDGTRLPVRVYLAPNGRDASAPD
ncbi:MAG: acetyltransferase [Actinomycetia bacterium]|nr:acetyltransferase [Actinomycetes bacterium]